MEFNRKSFIFHRDWYNAISQLDKDLRLELYDAIMRKALYNEPPSLLPMGSLAMSFIEPQIERDFDKWLDIREKRSNAGKAHKGNQHSVVRQTKQKQTNGTSVPSVPTLKQNGTNGTVSVSVSDNVSVDNNSVILKEKEDTKVSPKKKDEWRDNYDVYVSLIDDALGKLFVDEDYKNQMEQLYTNIDYKRTLIACSLYWKQEEQWKTYKRKKTKKPNFVSAIKNGFHINKVYKSKYASEIKEYGYPKSVEDVTIDDTQSTLIQFQYWMEGKMIKVWDGFDKGFPTTDAQYKLLLDHTIGGAKGFSYVVLVFNRDGWDKYKDERGFMFTYSNYIKANGLYKE